MKAFHKKRLLKLAAFLDTVPNKAFDMSLWQAQGADKPEGKRPGDCGFAGCAMGWAAHTRMFRGLSVEPYGLLIYQPDGGAKYTERYWEDYEAAAAVFEITEVQALHLFAPSHYESQFRRPTPKYVAKRIRKFVETNGAIP